MTPQERTGLDRRAFLKALAAAGLAACVPSDSPTVEVPSGALPSHVAATPSARPTPSPRATEAVREPVARFEPLAQDAYPNAKRLAGRFVESLTTYGPRHDPRRIVRRAARRADDAFDVRKVARRTQDLFVPKTFSRGRVVYPQLGGLDLGGSRDRICVMVVVRQEFLANRDGTEVASAVTRAVDVRLVIRDDEWHLEDVADAGGAVVEESQGEVPVPARRVLDDSRIELPDAARWDILRGEIDDRLLTAMTALADIDPYAVAVLKSGHPVNVFGTDRVSGHTLGRGVDIWRVAGQPVVLQHEKSSAAYRFTRAALEDIGVPELGSPWDLDGPPEPGRTKPSFTDAVHADHIHVAFKGG